MTLKRREILSSSLELFAEQGVKDTSTKQIAQKAKVSEGLIFRHFQNKTGLIKAVIANAFDRIEPYVNEIAQMHKAEDVLNAMIDLPFKLLNDEPTYWRLQMTIKFQNNLPELMDQCNSHSPILYEKAIEAFQTLGYDHPEKEAQLFHMIFEGIIHRLIFNEMADQLEDFCNFLRVKYNVNKKTLA